MTPSSCPSLQTAALPFVLPWKALVQDLDVVSLGPAPRGWKRLLAGQGIALHEREADQLPQGCQVASGFDRLDGLTDTAFATWAETALTALTPGGILVLGGTEPTATPAGQQPLSALRAAHLLEAAGCARVRVLPPAAPRYALVAQAPAQGAAFDLFSPVFLATPSPAENTPLARSEAALQQLENHLHARTDRLAADLRDQLHRTEADLRDQLQRAEARLNDQQAEITGLRATIAELQRLTRRRGLRKLAHKIKQARRKDKEAAALPPAPASTPPAAALPAPAEHTTPPPANPTPLSARETALRAQLFDSGNT